MLALVLGDRPLRTGLWFYAGALGATLGIGVLAAFVLGNAAASHTSTPKTWVAVVDVVAGCLLLLYVPVAMRRPPDPRKEEGMIARMSKLATSPAIAVVGAGAALANPGAFIPIARRGPAGRRARAQRPRRACVSVTAPACGRSRAAHPIRAMRSRRMPASIHTDSRPRLELEAAMQIGKPKRIYTVEPIEDPVSKTPSEKPSEEPDRETEARPLEPVELDAARA